MLRISQTSTREAQITLRLEGEINGRWVEELRRECLRALGGDAPNGRQLVLNLVDVSSIDAAALALFRELRARRVVVTNCSPYVAELLENSIHQPTTHQGEADA
jgi:anti-anti-sigma factor